MTTQPGAYQLTKVCIIVWILVLLALFSPISVNCEFWKFCGFCLPWEECTCVVAHFDCCGWFSGYCTYCFNVALHLKPFASNLLSYVLVPFACLAWTTHRDQIYRIVLSRISHQLDWNIYMYIHSLEMAHWSHHFPNQLYINFRTTVLSTGFYAQPEAVTFSIQPPTNVVTCAGCGEVVLTCGISLQRATTNLPVPELRWTFNGAMVRE